MGAPCRAGDPPAPLPHPLRPRAGAAAAAPGAMQGPASPCGASHRPAGTP